jgi:hypothetical protein
MPGVVGQQLSAFGCRRSAPEEFHVRDFYNMEFFGAGTLEPLIARKP